MAFVIQAGIPKTTAPRGRKPTEFPFGDMEVGTSFLIPVEKTEDTKEFEKTIESWRRKLRTSLKSFNEEFEGKFETGVVTEKDEDGATVHGVRVWRTA